MEKEGRVAYFDALRVLAILGVLFIHSSALGGGNQPVTLTYFIYNRTSRFCVPLFFMVSGAIFLNPQKSVSIKNIFFKYAFRIFLVYSIISFLYALFGIVWIDTSKMTIKEVLLNVFHNTVSGHYHLWFLKAIFGLYILTPIFRVIAKNKSIVIYWLLLTFCFTSLAFILRSSLNGQFLTIFNSLYDDTAIYLPQWSMYYFLGHYINTLKHRIPDTLLIVCCILCLSVMCGGDYILSYSSGSNIILFSDYISPFTVLLAISLFALFKQKYKHGTRLVCCISACSFGIYLFHDMILQAINNAHLLSNMHYVFSVPIKVLILLSASLAITFLLRKITLFKALL